MWGGSLQLSAFSFELLGESPLGVVLMWDESPGALSGMLPCRIVTQTGSRLKTRSSRLFRRWAFGSYGAGPSALSFEPSAWGRFAAGLSAHVRRELRSFEQYAAMPHCNSSRLEAEGSRLIYLRPLSSGSACSRRLRSPAVILLISSIISLI